MVRWWESSKTERQQRKKNKTHPLSLRQVSLPITTVIIPGIAILLKKWLPPNDRRLPICEGRYLSLTSGECWESSLWSVVAENILGPLQSDLFWVYKLFTNGRPRNSGVLFLDGSLDTEQLNQDQICFVAHTPFRSNEKWEETLGLWYWTWWLSSSLHIWCLFS